MLDFTPARHMEASNMLENLVLVRIASPRSERGTVRHLEQRLRILGVKLSPERIRGALMQVQLSILKHEDTSNKYGIPSVPNNDAHRIYKANSNQLSRVPFEISTKR